MCRTQHIHFHWYSKIRWEVSEEKAIAARGEVTGNCVDLAGEEKQMH